MNNNQPKHFIVIVPGYMGSKLKDKTTGEIVWIDFGSIPVNPLEWDDWIQNLFIKMAYPNDNLVPAGIVEEVLILPPWVKQEQYGRLLEALGRMGYRVDPSEFAEDELDVYTFAYDWRQDNRISARQLGEAIDRWSTFHPRAKAWIIGHSNGGIVSRWYIEKEGGKDHVGKLILMGSPWDGAPKGMRIMFSGLDTFLRRRFTLFGIPELTREVIRTFPSAYQLIPVQNPFLRDLNNEVVDPYTNTLWLDNDHQRELLEDGRKFTEDLGTTLSVETLCFFGRKLPTQSYGEVSFEANGRWRSIEWHATEVGDGTVPERSAVHPNAHEKLPFVVGHGDIYINPAVLEFLQWKLVDKYQLAEPELSVIITDDLSIMFEPGKTFYAPGEQINFGVTINENTEPPRPISDAQIQVKMNWHQQLPGDVSIQPPSVLPQGNLWENETQTGSYEGNLLAPDVEGYYQLIVTVEMMGHPAFRLEESIAVEAEA